MGIKKTNKISMAKLSNTKSQKSVNKSEKPEMKGKKSESSKVKTYFGSYISKIMKQVNSEMKLGRSALNVIDSIIFETFLQFSDVMVSLKAKEKAKTLSTKDVQAAVKLICNGELQKHCLMEGAKAIVKYTENTGKKTK